MGALTSRQNIGVEEVDITVNHAYRYPPKSGNYFSSHFIMGGERFDTAQPEMYLFGENMDLNFLGSRPAPFPYPAPSASEPSRTLKALVNIRKESLRFVRVSDDSLSLKEPETRVASSHFNIEFTFDCDVRCAITIMYFCTEEVTNTGLVYTPRDPAMNSETYHYKRGANQQFSQVCHVFDPSQYPEENLLYSFDRDIMPIVIYCVAEEGEEPYQSHSTIAIVEKHSDGYSLKPLKQKLFVDGLCYLLQEIYGIENKNTDSKLTPDDDPDDNGAECVICMCDLRDTLILPCRHLCLCNCCADSLRYQANNCPICRAPFRALLQIKALQKSVAGTTGAASSNNENGESIPPGYEAVSLIEALNGPSVAPQQPTAPPYQNMYVQLPQSATDGGLDGCLDDGENTREYQDPNYNSHKVQELEDSTTQTEKVSNACDASDIIAKGAATQMRMSVLMAHESEESIEMKSEESSTSPPSSASKIRQKLNTPEDIALRSSDLEISKESIDGTVKKKSKTPSSATPSGLRSASSSYSIKETSLCSNPTDEVEEMAETLSLLEDLTTDTKPSEVVINSSPSKTTNEKNDFLPREISVENGTTNQDSIHSASTGGDISNPSGLDLDSRAHNYQKQVSSSCEGIGHDERTTPKERTSRKNKHKSNNSNGRKNKGTTSRNYNPTTNAESLASSEDQNSGLTSDSQSLPGTPLSHSSVISRSSDASVSSASSTRALIISHPSQSSSTVI